MSGGATEAGKREVRISVPGKVLLAGEYAVLDGSPALAVAVERRLTVTARHGARTPHEAIVRSDLWREPRRVEQCAATGDEAREPLLAAVRSCLDHPGAGGEDNDSHGTDRGGSLDVEVRSDIDISHGLGSSSAVSLAALLACTMERAPDGWRAARQAVALQRRLQGRASGYDVATQLLGGVVRFRAEAKGAGETAWPAEATPLGSAALKRLDGFAKIFVGGRGAPTTEQMASVGAWLAADPQRRPELVRLSERLVSAFEDYLTGDHAQPAASIATLIAAMAAHRGFFTAAPAFPAAPFAVLADVPGFDRSFSGKPTGAGGEDALLLIGDIPVAAVTALASLGWQPLNAPFAADGVRREERI